jgi:hypothetical protein
MKATNDKATNAWAVDGMINAEFVDTNKCEIIGDDG